MSESTEGSLILGRASDCDLVVAHPAVSLRHAELRREGTRCRLVDLSSTNGTFVNDVRVSSQVLREGDVVSLGPVALKFRNGSLEIGVSEAIAQSDRAPGGKLQRLCLS